MRLLPTLALLLPLCVQAGVSEYFADGYGESMGGDEMRLLSWYAVAICAFLAVKIPLGRSIHDPQSLWGRLLKGAAYACAALGFWVWPQAGAWVVFAGATGLIIMLGLSRR